MSADGAAQALSDGKEIVPLPKQTAQARGAPNRVEGGDGTRLSEKTITVEPDQSRPGPN